MRLKYLLSKEFKQIFRNTILPKVFVVLPIVLMTVVPLVATQEIKGLKLCVIDNDHSSLSQRLIQKINASSYIDLVLCASDESEALLSIHKSISDIFIEIPLGFEKAIYRDELDECPIYVAANSTNGMKGNMGQSYIQQILVSYMQEVSEERGKVSNLTLMEAYTPVIRYAFNTYLDYKIYMIPAVFALALTLIVGFLPALNIVGEKERGTIEQVNVTPIGKFEFIISKLIPYWCIGLVMSLIALIFGWIYYGIFPHGSILLMFLFIFLFCILISSFALVISNYSKSTQQAALTMFFFLVVFIIMSGILTPICSMPVWAQWLSYLDPMRHIIEALRLIYVKGSSFFELLPQFYALVIYGAVTSFWSILSYKKNE